MKQLFNMFLILLIWSRDVHHSLGKSDRPWGLWAGRTCLYNHQISAKAGMDGMASVCTPFMDSFGAGTVCTLFTSQLTSPGPASHHVRLLLGDYDSDSSFRWPVRLYHRALEKASLAEHQVSSRLLALKAL